MFFKSESLSNMFNCISFLFIDTVDFYWKTYPVLFSFSLESNFDNGVNRGEQVERRTPTKKRKTKYYH